MLEHSSLTLDSRGPARIVRDSTSGEILGKVVAVRRGWPRPRLTAIHEGPDDSLLAVASRSGWFGPLVICDAEGQPVAKLRGGRLNDAEGQHLARRRGESYVSAAGDLLATWSAEPHSLVVQFDARTDGLPFVRMALLAAVLAG